MLQNDTAALATASPVADFLRDASIETTPGAAAKVADFRHLLPVGTRVAVTFLPGSDWRATVETAARLSREGMEPVPHVAARSLPDARTLKNYLAGLVGEAGVSRAVVLAGAVARPCGPFASSMELLDSGAFLRHGIRTLGIAGHPEGSPDIPDQALWEALRWKQDYAARTGSEVFICTQFAFEAEPIIAWDHALSDHGIDLPVRVGVPGPATLKTLLNHARACGIGPSMRFLTRQARDVRKLMTVNAPDRLIQELAAHVDRDPSSRIAGVHLYSLGGVARAVEWLDAARSAG